MQRRTVSRLMPLFPKLLLTMGALLVFTPRSPGYAVGPPVALEKMTETADLLVKAKVVRSDVVSDDWFKPLHGFVVKATRFEVISVLKGVVAEKATISFRHYAIDPSNAGFSFMPQHYEFVSGQSYVLFACKTDAPGVYRQLWLNHTGKEDLGALRAADEQPRTEKNAKDLYWTELTTMLRGGTVDDLIYAIHQLDEMSGGVEMDFRVFDRAAVAEVIRPLLQSASDEKVLAAAIALAGSGNPFMSDDRAAYWLATVGDKGHLPGLGTHDPKFSNTAGRLLWRELSGLADGAISPTTRALAIRALGRSGADDLPVALQRWCVDGEVLVRQAAVLLLAEVREPWAQLRIASAAEEASPAVRQSAARAIGFGQIEPMVPLLGKLLKDQEPSVRDAAALSLLSFPIAGNAGELLRANVADTEYHSLFVNALATTNPAQYTAELGDIIVRQLQPSRFSGGRIPFADAWDILFRYVQSRPSADARSGSLDASFDALEKMKWYSSSEPRDLYALYVQRGLSERAKAFREAAGKQVGFDLDYYFKMVDASPETYKRE